jgi:hypothetical protein
MAVTEERSSFIFLFRLHRCGARRLARTPRTVRFQTTRFMISREISLSASCAALTLSTQPVISGSLKYSLGCSKMQQHPEKIPPRRLSYNVEHHHSRLCRVRHDASVNSSETALRCNASVFKSLRGHETIDNAFSNVAWEQ